MSKRSIYTFSGEKIDVKWDKRLCIHVGECVRAKGELFVQDRKPWCEPDTSEKGEVQEIVTRCPTGALTFDLKGSEGKEESTEGNAVVVAANGPLYFRGNLNIDGAQDDQPGTNQRAALCRCGDSKNKPFCDNSHQDTGFNDQGAIGELGLHIESADGPLEVKRAKNGPLLISGNFRMVTSSGRVAWSGQKAALCRCGQSTNKPFCDGKHKSVGFEAD